MAGQEFARNSPTVNNSPDYPKKDPPFIHLPSVHIMKEAGPSGASSLGNGSSKDTADDLDSNGRLFVKASIGDKTMYGLLATGSGTTSMAESQLDHLLKNGCQFQRNKEVSSIGVVGSAHVQIAFHTDRGPRVWSGWVDIYKTLTPDFIVGSVILKDLGASIDFGTRVVTFSQGKGFANAHTLLVAAGCKPFGENSVVKTTSDNSKVVLELGHLLLSSPRDPDIDINLGLSGLKIGVDSAGVAKKAKAKQPMGARKSSQKNEQD